MEGEVVFSTQYPKFGHTAREIKIRKFLYQNYSDHFKHTFRATKFYIKAWVLNNLMLNNNNINKYSDKKS